MDAKRDILEKIRKALVVKTPQPYPNLRDNEGVFPLPYDDPEIVFAHEFVNAGGFFYYCENETELAAKLRDLATQKDWHHLYCWDSYLKAFFQIYDFRNIRIGHNLDRSDAGITGCELLIARTGSVFMSSAITGGRELSVFPPAHIVIARVSQVVYNISEAFDIMREKYPDLHPSQYSIITGPSRTADIEKKLVLGAHGPKEIHVFLLDDRAAE